MRVYRLLLPLLASFLLLSIGGPMLIERAYAVCRPWPACCWQGIVAGTVTVTNPTAHITTSKLDKAGSAGLSLDVDVSQEMLDVFKKGDEGKSLIGVPVIGFIILTEMTMTGFVPYRQRSLR